MSPSLKRAAAGELAGNFPTSERRVCALLELPRATRRYQAVDRAAEKELRRRICEIVRKRPRFGYRRVAALLRREGLIVNLKRVHRLCRLEGLKVRRRVRRRLAKGGSANACGVRPALGPNDVWCCDFVFGKAASGATLKWLSVVDEHTRECVALKVSRRLNGDAVIEALLEAMAGRGAPRALRSDNGSEFVSASTREWLERLGIEPLNVAPASPWENGHAESFHSKLVDEFLNVECFANVAAARLQTEAWRLDYNHARPHRSLGYRTPAEFAALAVASPARPLASPSPLPPTRLDVPLS